MKMKPWTYLGWSLLASSSLLLGVRGAAEELYQRPFSFQPSLFWGMHLHRRLPSSIPLKYVTVRLWADKPIPSVWLKSLMSVSIDGSPVKGAVFIKAVRGQVEWREKDGPAHAGKMVKIRPVSSPILLHAKTIGKRLVSGDVLFTATGNRLVVVNRLDLESYVSGVVEPELGALEYQPEVLKAQVVAARSYILAMKGHRHGRGYEFCDTQHCQMYQGISKRQSYIEYVVEPVRGQTLLYKDAPIAAFYHHSCGGATSNIRDVWPIASVPYLRAVPETTKSLCHLSKAYAWRCAMSREALTALFRRMGWLDRQETLEGLQIVNKDTSGRVKTLLIQSKKPRRVPVARFRHALNQSMGQERLKSALFTVTRDGDRFIFKGRGWGHGVGLCQEGAKEMAMNGKTYQDILAHYFPGAVLSPASK